MVTATAVGIVWAYQVRFCAFAPWRSGYARIPQSFDESARMLGTGSWGLLVRVHWPLLKRSTAAALLVFVDVMKELLATMVPRPFNSDSLVAQGLVPVIMLNRTGPG